LRHCCWPCLSGDHWQWINFFNFMMASDGLVAVASSVVFAVSRVSSGRLALAPVGALLGFLIWNWEPARLVS